MIKRKSAKQNIFSSLISRAFFALIFVSVFVLGLYVYATTHTVTDTFTDASGIASGFGLSVDTGSGELRLAEWYCNDSVWYCAAPTTCLSSVASSSGLVVERTNHADLRWKTAASACEPPQCSLAGGQSTDALVPDFSVDFSAYPAQDYCKAIGARLPTRSELSCIFTNRASYGNDFLSAYYWSADEYSTSDAYILSFSTGSITHTSKTSTSYKFRCVRDVY